MGGVIDLLQPRAPAWLIISLCAVEFAAAQPTDPPALTTLRYDEDYGYLRDPASATGAWWEPLKFVPLDQDRSASASFGFEARTRYEWVQDNAFGQGPQDTGGYVWTRLMPHLDLRVPLGDPATTPAEFRAFAQLLVAHEFGDDAGPSPVDENRGDLLQAFGELKLPITEDGDALTLRGGRSVLSLGSERLVGKRYGPNVMRSFDGAAATLALDSWTVQGLWARPVVNETGAFDDRGNDAQTLWGVYGTRDVTPWLDETNEAGLDLYYLGFLDTASVFVQNPGDPQREERHTLGSRFFGEASLAGGTLDWNLEGMFQFGTFGDGDIAAWSIASDTGYTFTAPWTPRVGLKANIISGDRDPNDDDLQTFNPLFPKGQYFGELSPIGPYNLVNLQGAISIAPTERWSITLQGGPYWRQTTDDGVYGIPGDVIREPGGSDERFIGWQWECLTQARITRELSVLLSYSQFHPGGFIDATGSDEVIHFAAVEVAFRF